MKNYISIWVFLLVSSLVFSKENIMLSGKISNASANKITLKGESFDKEIILKDDGSFNETFSIDYEGAYIFGSKNNRIALYLGKGTKLSITADEKDFAKTIKFTGNGSLENSYWKEKNEILNAGIGNIQEFYSLEEPLYIEKVKALKSNVLELFKKTKFTNKFFKDSETKSIDYFEQMHWLIYERYHEHYAKKEGFKTSESFPKTNPSIDFDNETDFLFSNHYKQLVINQYNQMIANQLNKNDEYTYKIALPAIKQIKSPSIKNVFIQNLAYEVIAGNPDAEMLYNEIMSLSDNQKLKEVLTAKFNKIKTLTPGKPSPTFDYENYKGGSTSLESLRGKYVYIDVWATWCGPCRREIPSLQKIEQEYHGKNIEFVSLSIDAKKDYEKWRKFVDEKKLGGIQLFADQDWNSTFVKDYAIEGIPRFILVDPNGNIVTSDAPRPSDPKLIEKFKELGI